MSSSASGGPPHLLRARLAEIDAETAVLHARLTVLAAERKSIVQDLRSVIYSGVVSLPPEIIAEIFLQYVTFGEIVSPYPNPHESTPHSYGPLLLSSVCRRWREIALALQPIWSNFVIRTSDDSISSAVSLLERWIPRAGNHPLTVAVLRHDWEMSIFTTLAPAFHHLQSFECFVDCERSFSNDVIRGRVPRLRSLRLSSDVLDEDQVLPEPLTAFSECPLLCEVYLSQFPWLSLVLPWPQITRLTSMSAGECLVIVRQTDALETLIASCYEFDDNWLWDGVPLQLSHLHTFKINRHRESIQLIDRLTLPSLTHIELPLPNQRLDAERLLGLIQRSAWRAVASVSLQDITWNLGELRSFLFALHNEAFVPDLTSLSLNPYVSAIEVPFHWLANALASNARDKLESFELVLAPSQDAVDDAQPTIEELDTGLEALRAVEARGLKLKIRGLQTSIERVDSIAVYP